MKLRSPKGIGDEHRGGSMGTQTAAEHIGRFPIGRRSTRRLAHGKTWALGCVDLISLGAAYAFTYAAAAHLGPLPPVSAPTYVLALVAVIAVPGWLAIFAAYGLYENDSIKISA